MLPGRFHSTFSLEWIKIYNNAFYGNSQQKGSYFLDRKQKSVLYLIFHETSKSSSALLDFNQRFP